MSIWLVYCILGILFLNVYPGMILQPAFSCSCSIQRPQAYEEADIVFAGMVVQKDYSSWIDGAMHVTFAISKSWKGTNAKLITVHLDSPGCGPPFFDNEEYLVVAYQDIFETKMRACSGTISTEDLGWVEPVIRYLDEHYAPITLSDKIITSDGLQILSVFLGISILTVLIITRRSSYAAV